MFCENCGAVLDDKAVVCPSCGQKVEGQGNNDQVKMKKGVGFATSVVAFVVNAYVIICAIAGMAGGIIIGVAGGIGGGGILIGLLLALLAAAISYVTTLQIRVMLNISRNSEIIANNLYYLSQKK